MQSITPRELGKEVFELVSSLTPMVNVDLLVKDPEGRSLLAWRNDQHTGRGWHIPGRVLRFKETLRDCLDSLIRSEFRTALPYDFIPLMVAEVLNQGGAVRGHFISILFAGSLPSGHVPNNGSIAEGEPGYLRWHDCAPEDLLSWHDMYRDIIDGRYHGTSCGLRLQTIGGARN